MTVRVIFYDDFLAWLCLHNFFIILRGNIHLQPAWYKIIERIIWSHFLCLIFNIKVLFGVTIHNLLLKLPLFLLSIFRLISLVSIHDYYRWWLRLQYSNVVMLVVMVWCRFLHARKVWSFEISCVILNLYGFLWGDQQRVPCFSLWIFLWGN